MGDAQGVGGCVLCQLHCRSTRADGMETAYQLRLLTPVTTHTKGRPHTVDSQYVLRVTCVLCGEVLVLRVA
jgi:hypothetical protein